MLCLLTFRYCLDAAHKSVNIELVIRHNCKTITQGVDMGMIVVHINLFALSFRLRLEVYLLLAILIVALIILIASLVLPLRLPNASILVKLPSKSVTT